MRPSASSSPRWATVSCRTFVPTRTERTSRQYVWVLQFLVTVECRRYIASSKDHHERPRRKGKTRGWHYNGVCVEVGPTNKQPRPKDVVLGGPPRGGHFR